MEVTLMTCFRIYGFLLKEVCKVRRLLVIIQCLPPVCYFSRSGASVTDGSIADGCGEFMPSRDDESFLENSESSDICSPNSNSSSSHVPQLPFSPERSYRGIRRRPWGKYNVDMQNPEKKGSRLWPYHPTDLIFDQTSILARKELLLGIVSLIHSSSSPNRCNIQFSSSSSSVNVVFPMILQFSILI
ncbi:hypothetical protein L1887_23502 [Cichorium endivia]|nr:hypothetical protein L1887_23502 [Cichorium endivia]